MGHFEQRLQHYADQVKQYHDPEKQELARATVPLSLLEEKAAMELAKEGKLDPSKEEIEHYNLIQLLFWFKTSFSWVNSPPCSFCASKTDHVGMGLPTAEDLQFGADRIEIYICELCETVTRFPRYNDPVKLMETQCGRCGEWANCFTFYCVALGYDARLVMDFTDHVWTECFSPCLGRWMHLDPCEASYDKPLLYEQGWSKKLSYIIAFGKDGVHDVTKRYTRKWPEVLSRRNIVSEDEAEETVALLTAMQRSTLEPEELDCLAERDELEREELARALEDKTLDESLPGRQSGSKEWRQVRGEFKAQDIHESRSFCPTRICVDDHVGKIYKALGMFFFKGDDGLEKLKAIHSLLIELKSQGFKVRRLHLEAEDTITSCIETKAAAALLDAIGLTTTRNLEGKVDITMKEPPVKVALALAVAVENTEKFTSESFDSDSVQLMVEGERICGGICYATGENPPTGIASVAFDGLYSSKWEEPEGAKGACIVYQLPGEDTHVSIVGYDLVSANDCSERDPSDWVLEANINGKTWELVDKRSGEQFPERFQRRCFKFPARSLHCKALRLRFSSVGDPTKTSRLQLSCVDFYIQSGR